MALARAAGLPSPYQARAAGRCPIWLEVLDWDGTFGWEKGLHLETGDPAGQVGLYREETRQVLAEPSTDTLSAQALPGRATDVTG